MAGTSSIPEHTSRRSISRSLHQAPTTSASHSAPAKCGRSSWRKNNEGQPPLIVVDDPLLEKEGVLLNLARAEVLHVLVGTLVAQFAAERRSLSRRSRARPRKYLGAPFAIRQCHSRFTTESEISQRLRSRRGVMGHPASAVLSFTSTMQRVCTSISG